MGIDDRSPSPERGSPPAPVPFVRLNWEPGLHGVTKLCWRSWTARNWLSWVLATLFIGAAAVLVYTRTVTFQSEPPWHVVVRLGRTATLVVLAVTRLVIEGTVSRPKPGQPPPWDRQLVDPWWTTIHTLSGFVLGLWLTPMLIVVAFTAGWELLEICVPGFGDEEVNGNRLIDNVVAWLGWWLSAGVFARPVRSRCQSGEPVPGRPRD